MRNQSFVAYPQNLTANVIRIQEDKAVVAQEGAKEYAFVTPNYLNTLQKKPFLYALDHRVQNESQLEH